MGEREGVARLLGKSVVSSVDLFFFFFFFLGEGGGGGGVFFFFFFFVGVWEGGNVAGMLLLLLWGFELLGWGWGFGFRLLGVV